MLFIITDSQNMHWWKIGVGVTNILFVNFSIEKIFSFAKMPVEFFESLSYLTGVTAAELWQHL